MCVSVCVCFWLIYAAWPHRRLNVASLEATLWSRTRSIGQWHIIYVCLSSCLQGLFTHTHQHSYTYTCTVASLGGGATSMTTKPVKSFAAKKFCLSAFKLRPDPMPDPPDGPKKKKTRTSHSFYHSCSLPLPASLFLSWDLCRLAKVSWLINVPVPCGSFTSAAAGTPTIYHLFLLNCGSCHAHAHQPHTNLLLLLRVFLKNIYV